MKYLEKIRVINSSDMENWGIPEDKSKYTGTKNLNLKLGQEVEELLEEYGLKVDVGSGEWLHKQDIVLKSEEGFKEYRVHLSTIMPWEDFLENEGIDENEFNDLPEDEQERLNDEYKSSKINDDTRLEFSVFLPIGTDNLVHSALSDASNYLKMLNNCLPEMLNCSRMEDTLSDNTKGFKCFLNSKNLSITNDNIEDIPTINYRIYKDSKFFVELKEEVDSYRHLINDWLNLIK